MIDMRTHPDAGTTLNRLLFSDEHKDVRTSLVADDVADASSAPGGRARARQPRGAFEPADDALVARVVAGDQSALGELYDRYSRQAYSLARRICVDEGFAEDVVQEVFLAFWRDPGRFDAARGAFGTWLLTLVHHKAVDAVRREGAIRKRTVPALDDGDERPATQGPGRIRPRSAPSSRARCGTRSEHCRSSSARHWRWRTSPATPSGRSRPSPACPWAR